MSPAHVLEPTYQRLKRGLKEGLWPAGSKLEALCLADEFGVSMTPVRDSLNQLAGEGLVEMRPGEGFRVMPMSERLLRDLLELHELLLAHSIATPRLREAPPPIASRESSYADRVADAFGIMAERSGNSSIAASVRSIGDRLHAIRMVEPLLFSDALGDIEEIEAALTQSSSSRMTRVVGRFHERRRRSVIELVALLG